MDGSQRQVRLAGGHPMSASDGNDGNACVADSFNLRPAAQVGFSSSSSSLAIVRLIVCGEQLRAATPPPSAAQRSAKRNVKEAQKAYVHYAYPQYR